MRSDKVQPMPVSVMSGLILVLFEKNKYCANQISAVLEIVTSEFEKHKNLEPIMFDTALGKSGKIKRFEEFAVNEAIRNTIW